MRLSLQQKIEKLRKLCKVYGEFERNDMRTARNAEEAGDEETAKCYYGLSEGYRQEVATIKQIIRFLENDQEELSFINNMIDE